MHLPRTIALALFFTMGCAGTGQVHPLARSGAAARATLPAIEACAREQGKDGRANPDAVHVKISDQEWLYFRVNVQDSLEMVVHVMVDGVPPARMQELKAIGDSIWSCAEPRPLGAITAPVSVTETPAIPGSDDPAPPAAPPPAAPPPAAPAGKLVAHKAKPATPVKVVCTGKPSAEIGGMCKVDPDCGSNNCVSGCCYGRDPGHRCENDVDCNSNSCVAGQCESREVSSPCEQDVDCDSNNCTAGICESRESGAYCQNDVDCNSNNCTHGVCQTREPGSACKGDVDCNSNKCGADKRCT